MLALGCSACTAAVVAVSGTAVFLRRNSSKRKSFAAASAAAAMAAAADAACSAVPLKSQPSDKVRRRKE